MFLSARFGRSNRRWMTDLTVDSQFFHQLQKPLHRPRRFDPYAHRTGKRGIKLPHVVAFVCEGPIHHFPRQSVQHRHGLLASVQITSYNLHLGLLRSEHCWGEHRTVYSGRSEADVVMTSIRSFAFSEYSEPCTHHELAFNRVTECVLESCCQAQSETSRWADSIARK